MEVKIIDGTKHIDEVKKLILEYTKFLDRDLSFQDIDDELKDLSLKFRGSSNQRILRKVNGQFQEE